MYLGIINGWEEGHFKAVSELGLQGIEFCINGSVDSAPVLAKADEIRANSEKYGVRVGSVGRWGMPRVDEKGEVIPAARQHDLNLIDLCEKVGCPVYNVGCNWTEGKTFYENCQIAIGVFSYLIGYARDKGVKIAVYNCDWANFVWCEKAWSVVMGALPELGIKYDPSHSVHRGTDCYKELHDWVSRVYHFHLKGTMMIAGESVDDPPVGLDDLNWRAVMSILYAGGYDGMLSIEPHSHLWRGARGQWGIDFTINYMRPFIMPADYPADDDPYMP